MIPAGIMTMMMVSCRLFCSWFTPVTAPSSADVCLSNPIAVGLDGYHPLMWVPVDPSSGPLAVLVHSWRHQICSSYSSKIGVRCSFRDIYTSEVVQGIGSCGHPSIGASLLYWAGDFISGFCNLL